MRNNRTTISIGITAFNEEKHIENVLNAIMNQQVGSFVIDEIFVVCDGSTDNTPTIVQDFAKSYPVVTVTVFSVNKGKIYRLNQIFRHVSSNVLILFDADILITDTHLLEKLVAQFSDPTVGLVGGNDQPIANKKLFSHILKTSITMWYRVRTSPSYKNSVYNSHGCILALSKKLYQKLSIPNTISADDEFLYFSCVENNLKFIYAQNAIVHYLLPSNFSDYLKQHRRYLSTKYNVVSYFGKDTKKKYKIRFDEIIKGVILTFFHQPFYTIGALFLEMMVRFPHQQTKSINTWERIHSTKI